MSSPVPFKPNRFTTWLAVVMFGLALVLPMVWAASKTMEEAEDEASAQLAEWVRRIQGFHTDMGRMLLDTVRLSIFTDYFNLAESRKNRYTSEGNLQLSHRQIAMRQEMERLVIEQHKSYPVTETCLVDRHGQEHMRAIQDLPEDSGHFSDSEFSSPFFEPTLTLKKGEVYLSVPYVSPDTQEWVVAFSTPVVVAGETMAFLHMEVPLAFYQRLISIRDYSVATHKQLEVRFKVDRNEEGRTFILDGQGRLLADSRQQLNFKSRVKRATDDPLDPGAPSPPEELHEYTPLMRNIASHALFREALQKALEERSGLHRLKIGSRDYVMAFRPVPDRPWIILHVDPVAGASTDTLLAW